MNTAHILIFAHGFGVRKDDRGLLTDIAAGIPEVTSVLFDLHEVDEAKKTITMRPLGIQAKMLTEKVEAARKEFPDATIDIVAHSQGCIVAALAKASGVRKTILLAPPFDMTVERTVRRYQAREGVKIDLKGTSNLGVLDGYMRMVPKEHWEERRNMDPLSLYNDLAEHSEVILTIANQDEILEAPDLSGLSPKITQAPLDGTHNFGGAARQPLIEMLRQEIL